MGFARFNGSCAHNLFTALGRLLPGLSNRQGRLIEFSRAVECQQVLSISGAGNSGRFIIEGIAISFWAKALNCFQILRLHNGPCVASLGLPISTCTAVWCSLWGSRINAGALPFIIDKPHARAEAASYFARLRVHGMKVRCLAIQLLCHGTLAE